MDIDAIFLIGPQGSGKGTQAKLLADKLGFFYCGSGAILRDFAAHDDDLGKKIASVINDGKLVDDATLFEVIKEKLADIPNHEGVIFDGVPRRVSQADYLIQFLGSIGKNRLLTLHVKVPHDESVKRLLKRAEIEGRADDTRERIEFRLKQYDEETVPVLDYLRPRTRFVEIDGVPPPDVVTREIDRALGISSHETEAEKTA